MSSNYFEWLMFLSRHPIGSFIPPKKVQQLISICMTSTDNANNHNRCTVSQEFLVTHKSVFQLCNTQCLMRKKKNIKCYQIVHKLKWLYFH
jgi:hypothetical protein